MIQPFVYLLYCVLFILSALLYVIAIFHRVSDCIDFALKVFHLFF